MFKIINSGFGKRKKPKSCRWCSHCAYMKVKHSVLLVNLVGKSTFARAIIGLVKASRGTVMVR